MGVHLGNAATTRFRAILALGLVLAVVASFFAMIVVLAFVLARGARDMLLCAQAICFGLTACLAWAVARREHRNIDRAQVLVFGGLAASAVGQLLTNRYHPRALDVVVGSAGFGLICVGLGLMVISYIGNRRAEKGRQRRALMARFTHALRLRSAR